MIEQMKTKVDEMLSNYLELEKAFIWEHSYVKHYAALLYTQHDKEIDIEGLKNAVKVLKNQTSNFSHYRGTYKFIIASLLVTGTGSVENTFAKVLACEEILKNVGFKSGAHMPVASYTLYKSYDIVEDFESTSFETIASKAFVIYNDMKVNHPWLTNSEDYALSILLAKDNQSTDQIEAYYQKLSQNGFSKGNDLQRLSHILSLSKENQENIISRVLNLKQELKSNKLNLYQGFYSALGIIALLGEGQGEITNDFIQTALYLTKQKKYKWLGKGMNILLSSALVADLWINKASENDFIDIAIGLTMETIIAAQTAAMIAALSATMAATAAASS